MFRLSQTKITFGQIPKQENCKLLSSFERHITRLGNILIAYGHRLGHKIWNKKIVSTHPKSYFSTML